MAPHDAPRASRCPIATAAASTKTGRRYDISGVLLRPHRRASDGVLLAEGIAIREGILEYPQADGSIRRELVTLDAVLDTARTLPRSALTHGHPKVSKDNPSGFVNADNAEKLAVGDIDGQAEVGGVIRHADGRLESDYEDAQGAFVKVKYAVRRKDAIEDIEAGHDQTSCGYDVVTDETPGEHPVFGRYDARQIGRTCNHNAVGIPKGRAGAAVAMRLDADTPVGTPAEPFKVLPAKNPANPTNPVQPTNTADNRRADTREVSMKPGLLALLACLGVERFDSEEGALEAALPIAKKALADQADAIKLRKDAEEMAGEESELEKLKKDMATKDAKIADLEGQLAKANKAEADRKDAADLADLQALATKAGVKHDGLALPALRLAIAKTRVDTLDDKSAAGLVDGVLMSVKSEIARKDAQGDPDRRFDFGGDPNKRDDGDPKGQRRDEFYNPSLAAADQARKDSFTTKGGEA